MRWLALATPLALTGCSGLYDLEVGYARSIGKSPDESAVEVNTHEGLGGGNDHGGGGAGAMERIKAGPNIFQFQLGPMGYATVGPKRGDPVAVYALGGFSLLQLESVRGQFAYGLFSPTAELGLAIRKIYTTLSVQAEYDVRFNDVPNTGYVCFMIGLGAVGFAGKDAGKNDDKKE